MDLNQVTLEATNFDESLKFYQKIGLKLIVLNAGRYARFELLAVLLHRLWIDGTEFRQEKVGGVA